MSFLGADLKILVSGMDETLDCILEARPRDAAQGGEHLRLHAALPGRIWRGWSETEPLILRLAHEGAPITRGLAVSREAVAANIEQLSRRKAAEVGIFETLSAVEHVKFGGLSPLLSPHAAAFIKKAAATFKLEAFLAEAEVEAGEAAPPPPAAKPPPAEQVMLAQLRQDFAEHIRSRSGDPLAALTQRLALLPDNRLKKAFLTPLTEYFCHIGEFPAFFTLWSQIGATLDDLSMSQNVNRSQSLPYLFMLGRYDRVAESLAAMTQDSAGWINTACVGWTMRAALQPDVYKLTAGDLLAISRAYMKLTTAQASTYWSRSSCRNLVDASAALLLHPHLFPEAQRDEHVVFALHCYGLSQNFWEALEAGSGGAELPHPMLQAGRAAFRAIQEHVDGPPSKRERGRPRLEDALRFFIASGTYEAPRALIELLGPAGQIDASSSALMKVRAQGGDLAEILLRHLAFPNAPQVHPSLAPTARRAIRERMKNMKRSHLYEMRIEAARASHALLSRLAKGRLTPPQALEELTQILAILNKLGGRNAHHADLCLGIALYCDLLRDERADLAQRMGLFLLSRLGGLAPEETKSLAENRFLRSLHRRFSVIAGRSGSAFAKSLFDQYVGLVRPPAHAPAHASPEMAEAWLRASALFDTLVLVYSCRAHLDTRMAEVRKSWLHKLEALGVPYLIVVGEGANEIKGDVLEVAAPDSYEGLPQKSLAMLRWAERRTDFAHVLKIDDDCFLDPEEYFFSLDHRLFNYYGREIRRDLGSKPRMWHMGRSAAARGRFELDKSPEPSLFADGGSGYALSRDALVQLNAAADTVPGRILTQSSFSEDKMVGDLLAMGGVVPRSEDYSVAVLRTTHPGGQPIMQWETTFFPGLMSGVKIAHMDNADDLARRASDFGKATLFPKKIWPSNGLVKLRDGCNSMTLVSSEARLAEVAAAPTAVAAVVRNETFMLPHFLAHYRKLGVTGFLIVDNCSDDGTLEYLMAQPDVAVFTADGSFRAATQGSDWKLAMLAQFRVGKWTLIADSDELLVYPGYETRSLTDYLADPAHGAADAFLTLMLDMYPRGSLSEATFAGGSPFEEAGYAERHALLKTSLSFGGFGNRATRTSSLRHRLIPGSRSELFVSEKVALVKYKPWMRFSVSMHYAAEIRPAAQPLILAHFKYNAEFRAKAVREIKRGQYFNNSEEYKKYLDILSEGRDVIFDPEHSAPWRECVEVKEILG